MNFFSTQNVNVARFARNVEWDFLNDFQILWMKYSYLLLLLLLSFLSDFIAVATETKSWTTPATTVM